MSSPVGVDVGVVVEVSAILCHDLPCLVQGTPDMPIHQQIKSSSMDGVGWWCCLNELIKLTQKSHYSQLTQVTRMSDEHFYQQILISLFFPLSSYFPPPHAWLVLYNHGEDVAVTKMYRVTVTRRGKVRNTFSKNNSKFEWVKSIFWKPQYLNRA